jgi:hypothetical protein
MSLTGLVGIGFNAYFPIAFQSFVETNYPAFELSLTTSLMFASNIFCFGGMQLLVVKSLQKWSLYVLVSIAAPFYLYMMMKYRTELRRLNAENLYSTSTYYSS